MAKTTHVSAFLLYTIMLAACARPLISNLQKGQYQYKVAPDSLLGVSVGVTPFLKIAEEWEKPKTFFDLRDSLAHVYLRIVASQVRHPDSLIKYLAKPIIDSPKKPAESKPTDFTLYKVQLHFGHWNKFYNSSEMMHGNTRLEYLTNYLTLPSGVSLYSVDKLQNEIDEIDLGTLSRDQTVTFNTKLTSEYGAGGTVNNTANAKNTSTSSDGTVRKETVYDGKGNVVGTIDKTDNIGGTLEGSNTATNTASANAKVAGELGYLNNETIKEAVALKLRRLRTGFSFSDKQLVVAQRGRPLGDISYNTIVTVTLKISNPGNVFSPNVYDFKRLFADSGDPVKANDLIFSARTVNFVPCEAATDVKIGTKYEGAIRAAGNEKGNTGNNALEYDDKVTFYKINGKCGDDVLIEKYTFCKKAFRVTATDTSGKRYILKIAAPNPEELLLFSDDKPEIFLQWVLEQRENPVLANLTTSKFKLYFERSGGAERLYLTKNGLSRSDISGLKALNDIKLEIRNR